MKKGKEQIEVYEKTLRQNGVLLDTFGHVHSKRNVSYTVFDILYISDVISTLDKKYPAIVNVMKMVFSSSIRMTPEIQS